MKDFFKILKLARPYRSSLRLNVLFNVLAAVFNLFSFVMFVPFLELLFNGDNWQEILKSPLTADLSLNAKSIKEHGMYWLSEFIQDHSKTSALWLLCGVIVVMMLFKNLFRYLALYSMVEVRNGIVKDYRNNIYSKIIDLPMSYFSSEKKGDLISKMTNDVKEIEWSVLRSVEAVYKDPITLVITIAVLLFFSAKMTLFILLLIPVVGIIMLIGKKLRKASTQTQEEISKMISTTEETLTGIGIIKVFNQQEQKKKLFRAQNSRYTKLMNSLFRRTDLASPVSEFLGTTVMIAALIYGGKLVFLGEMDGSDLMAYIGIFYTVIDPAKSFTQAMYNAQRGVASAERIDSILAADNVIFDPEQPSVLQDFSNKIEFKNVSFAYEEDKVLNNISFTLNKGETIALVGESGSGKSTIANLIPRFYDVDEGEITVDGINIKQLTQNNLRSHLGVVTQSPILFNDTIAGNICFGNKQDQNKTEQAAKVAHAHDFTVDLPKGYQTNIGDGGNKLSGGQKQRLSIARAVYKNPAILILDEATSALDTESEKLVQKALENLMQGRTSLVIAHRLSTIQNANQILVMEKGQIVERGTHAQLIGKQGVYAKLVEMQSFA